MAKIVSYRERYDNVQYRFHLIPNFKNGQGIVILKTHHSFGDGLSHSTWFLTMSGKYDAKNLPGLKPFGFIQ